jgi:hypothetical protein
MRDVYNTLSGSLPFLSLRHRCKSIKLQLFTKKAELYPEDGKVGVGVGVGVGGWGWGGEGAGFGIPSMSAAWLSNVASPYIFHKDMQGKKRFSNIAFQN